VPRPKVTRNLTTTQAARQLGMRASQLVNWVEHGALPAPTSVDDNGVRYFDHKWLKKAREIVRSKKNIE
jgi:DNA-binding transcriptional MerR regulator